MKVAIYARVSRDDKAEDGVTPVQHTENQVLQLREYCSRQGWTVVKEYRDEASGKSGDRGQFKAMMTAASRRQFDLVLVWALDRLTREGVGQTFEYIKRLKSHGVQFVSFTEEHFRTTGATGELMIAIAAWIAEQERKRMSERTKAGMQRARAQGAQIGRPSCVVDKDKLQALWEAGLSYQKIADQAGLSAMTVRRRLTKSSD